MTKVKSRWKRRIWAAILVLLLGATAISLFVGEVPFPSIRKKWSIGIYTGPTPFTLTPLRGLPNPVLSSGDVTDVPAFGLADPFLLREGTRWYLFFEVIRSSDRKGSIAYADSLDALHWHYRGIVLQEPFHLSYPYVFRWGNEIYMIPESSADQSVRLYRAVHFPKSWALVKTLLAGEGFQDTSIIHFQGMWWLFTSLPGNDTLWLYYAPDLEGPWRPHSANPIVKANPHIARPGGRLIVHDGRLYRFAQDDKPSYGVKVWAFRITELSPTTYQEEPAGTSPVLASSGSWWNWKGMHTVDPVMTSEGQWIASVDGAGLGVIWSSWPWRRLWSPPLPQTNRE